MEGLCEVFQCFICMQRLREARLCPHCSKLCCLDCIRRWLLERSVCPHCRSPLYFQELINCRWAEDVTQQLSALHSQVQNSTNKSTLSSGAIEPDHQSETPSDKCPVHQETLNVYCSCGECICWQCALWNETHKSHNFQPLNEIWETHVNTLKEQEGGLKQRLNELLTLVQDVERNVESVRQAKDERIRELRTAVEHMVTRLDSQLKHKLLQLVEQKNKLRHEIEGLEAILQDTDQHMKRKSKRELVACIPQLLASITNAQKQPMTSLVSSPIPADFPSEMVPPFDGSVFVVQPFSELRKKADPIYSPPLNCNGLVWRLKIYPDGNGVVRSNYLSVFLELSSGLSDTAKYEYRIEMVCQAVEEPARNIVREFASDFETGECWGYNRFFRLELLGPEGYHNASQDSVILRFQVRAPTYYQKSRDQQLYINNLLAVQAQQTAQLADLKERLARETNRTRRNMAVAAAPLSRASNSGTPFSASSSLHAASSGSKLEDVSQFHFPEEAIDADSSELSFILSGFSFNDGMSSLDSSVEGASEGELEPEAGSIVVDQSFLGLDLTYSAQPRARRGLTDRDAQEESLVNTFGNLRLNSAPALGVNASQLSYVSPVPDVGSALSVDTPVRFSIYSREELLSLQTPPVRRPVNRRSREVDSPFLLPGLQPSNAVADLQESESIWERERRPNSENLSPPRSGPPSPAHLMTPSQIPAD